MTRQRAIVELLIADLFWGFTFVATPMALRTWDSSQIAFLRFLIPAFLGMTLGFFVKPWRLTRMEFRNGWAPGIIFAATIYTQTLGLEYTTPSKSSFITGLYIIFVPLLEIYLYKKRLNPWLWVSLMGALVGLSMLFNLKPTQWNLGDSITVICALLAAWHIHQVGSLPQRYRHPLLFNLSQCFWAALFLLPLALHSQHPWALSPVDGVAVFGLMMITFGSTVVAFSIQARAQRHLELSTSSLIFILEAPIAMFFSWFLLNEPVVLLQVVGAGILLLACGIATRI